MGFPFSIRIPQSTIRNLGGPGGSSRERGPDKPFFLTSKGSSSIHANGYSPPDSRTLDFPFVSGSQRYPPLGGWKILPIISRLTGWGHTRPFSPGSPRGPSGMGIESPGLSFRADGSGVAGRRRPLHDQVQAGTAVWLRIRLKRIWPAPNKEEFPCLVR